MNNLYGWLYDYYVLPKLKDIERDHNDAITAYAERAGLSKVERLRLHDMVTNMRLEWGMEAFAIGVRFGLRLNNPRTRTNKDGWLLSFLP